MHEPSQHPSTLDGTPAKRLPDEAVRAGDGNDRRGHNHFQPCFA
jgi:hypothetical protein